MGKKLLVLALVVLVGVAILQTGLMFYQDKTQKSQLPSATNNRGIAITPSTIPTPSSPIPLSSPKKSSVNLHQVGKFFFWQDGMFRYRATSSAEKKVSPYAVIGIVNAIKDNTLEIVSADKDFSFSDTITKVKLVLAEKNNNVTLLTFKNGDVISSKEITWNDLKNGDRVEGHSLKVTGENYYSTSSIFVLK